MELEEYKDMYGLFWRVKEIRKSYKLLFNKRTQKVELHDVYFGGKCMVFDLPIMPNILQKIQATKIENATRLLKDIELKNCKIEQDCINNATNMAKNILNL